MRKLSQLAGLMLMLAPAFAGAAEPGDAQKGLAFATEVCADCHAVKANQEVSPVIKAPSFATVARSGLVTVREITAWIQSAHSDMPDHKLTPEQRDNVTAYIMSLAEKK